MAAKLTSMVAIILVIFMVVAPHAEGGLGCLQVSLDLAPCEPYLTNGGDLPESCCDGVRKLNAAANSSPDRKKACKCIKSLAKLLNINDDKYAMQVPAKCNVNIGYPISFKTDCNTVR